MDKNGIIRSETSSSRSQGSQKKQQLIINILWYLLLLTLAFMMILPFLWMISTSLKNPQEVFSYPPKWIPQELHFNNYAEAFKAAPFGRYFYNSVVIAGAVTIGQLISASLAAYAFARMNFRGKKALFTLFLSTTMISTQVTLVPSYLIIQNLNWIDTKESIFEIKCFQVVF